MVYMANAKTTVIFCKEPTPTPGYPLTFYMTLPLGTHTPDLNVLFSATLSLSEKHTLMNRDVLLLLSTFSVSQSLCLFLH